MMGIILSALAALVAAAKSAIKLVEHIFDLKKKHAV